MTTSKVNLTLKERIATTEIFETLEQLRRQLANYEHSAEGAAFSYEISRQVYLIHQQIEALELELKALVNNSH